MLWCCALPCTMQHKDNMEQRLKYAEQPEKFLDSEVDLDEQIKSLLQVGEGSREGRRWQAVRWVCISWSRVCCRWRRGVGHGWNVGAQGLWGSCRTACQQLGGCGEQEKSLLQARERRGCAARTRGTGKRERRAEPQAARWMWMSRSSA